MAEYATGFDKAGGYSFDDDAITDLWEQAKAFVGDEAGVEIKLEGAQRIRVKDVKEIFEDVFVKRAFIEQISISGSIFGATPRKAISINIRREAFADGVSFSISGDRHECTTRRTEIENIINASRLWYSFIFQRSASAYFFNGVITAVAVIAIFLSITRLFDGPIWVEVPIFVFAYICVSIIIGVFERVLFPKIIFDFGKSANVGQRATFWRNLLGAGIGVALVVGVVAGLVVEKIK